MRGATPTIGTPVPDVDPFARTQHEQAAVAEAAVAAVRLALANPKEADVFALSRIASQLQTLLPTTATETQFEALQGVGRFFLNQDRELPFAMEAAASICKLARGLGRKQQLFNGLLLQGVIAAQLTNSIEAIESFVAARDVAVELGLARGELVAVMNGAGVLLNQGHYGEALELLRAGLAIADRCDQVDDVVGTLLTNIAQCHLFLSDYEDGLHAITAAREFLLEPVDPHSAGNRATLEFTHLRLLIASKQGSAALANLDSQAKYAAMAGSVRARIDLSVARGLVEVVVGGKRDLGLSRIKAAREKAHLLPSTMPDVLNGMIAAAEESGRADEALNFRKELQSLLSSRQETSRFRAALLSNSALGIGTSEPERSAYDRRLDQARERLLRRP